MNRYHIRLGDKFRGPSRVSIAIKVGDRKAMVAFNKNQEDESASDFPRKTIWLQPEVALELKAVRAAEEAEEAG